MGCFHRCCLVLRRRRDEESESGSRSRSKVEKKKKKNWPPPILPLSYRRSRAPLALALPSLDLVSPLRL